MAGKGGAWKVAYADFVTAMMAFFLVMWLISQDQKVKESIARYFMRPVGFQLGGSSMEPSETGGLRDIDEAGPVPGSRTRSGGRGLGAAQNEVDPDNETLILSEWLFDDPQSSSRWLTQAAAQLEAARRLHPSDGNDRDLRARRDETAQRQLAIQLHDVSMQEARLQADGVYRELLLAALARVDWDQLASELLNEVADQPRRR